MKIETSLLSLLTFAMASLLLVHFGLLWASGRLHFYAANPLVLLMEIAITVAILGFNLHWLLGQLVQRKKTNGVSQPKIQDPSN